jgi:hypothetical protein
VNRAGETGENGPRNGGDSRSGQHKLFPCAEASRDAVGHDSIDALSEVGARHPGHKTWGRYIRQVTTAGGPQALAIVGLFERVLFSGHRADAKTNFGSSEMNM